MRRIMVMVCAMLLAGCASRPQQPPAQAAVDQDAALPAAALVFAPPVTLGDPPLELARDVRQPAAFVSYDQTFTTFFYLRMDDRQFISSDGRSQRRVVSETFGVSVR